jgi:hypothetical protein
MEHSHVGVPELSAVNRLAPGAPAPDAIVQDEHGAPVRLSELWDKAPRATVLVFLREFG